MAKKPNQPLTLISIIIPVFNEEKNILPAYQAIKAQFEALKDRYRMEIIFSDNHSVDGTQRELEQLAASDKSVKVIRLARNFGFQRSVLTAFRHASGEAAIQIDCDLQDPPEVIPLFLKKWEAGHDVVLGIRRKRTENWLLQISRRLYYKLVVRVSDDNIVENAGDFRLVDRSIIDQLSQINDARPYTRGLISSLAARQVGVEFDRRSRQFGKSKFPIWRLTSFAVDGIVSHSLFPLRLASFFGGVIFVVTFFLSLYYVFSYFFGGQAWPSGFATLVILLLMSIGLNAIFIGIVGEYIGRVYDQVRVRPLTVVENTINLPTKKSRTKKQSGVTKR